MSKLIFIFLGIVAILAIGFFLLWPKYQKFNELRVNLGNKELELQYVQDYYAKNEKLFEDLQEYQGQISKIELALPDDSSFAAISLINFIGNASSKSNLNLKELKSFSVTSPTPLAQTSGAPAQPSSKIKNILVDFTVSGSYFNLKNFIDALENSAKIIEVENLSFKTEKEEAAPSIDLKVKTFSY